MLARLAPTLLAAALCAAEPELTLKQRELRASFAQAGLTFRPIEELGKEGAEGKLVGLMRDSAGVELADEAMRASLAAGIADQMIARSRGVEAYLDLVERSEPRWITPDDDAAWFLIECDQQMTIRPTPGDRSDPRGTLAEIATKRRAASGVMRAWCAEPAGSAVVFYRAADEDTLHLGGFALRPREMNDMAYVGGAASALRAWRPPITGEELLERDGAALCADVLLMMRWSDDAVSAWQMIWSWDAQRQRWFCWKLWEVGAQKHAMCF